MPKFWLPKVSLKSKKLVGQAGISIGVGCGPCGVHKLLPSQAPFRVSWCSRLSRERGSMQAVTEIVGALKRKRKKSSVSTRKKVYKLTSEWKSNPVLLKFGSQS